MTLPLYVFAGGTAVVTGAASGIGEQLAYALARRGSNLVLLDRDESRLHVVAAAARAAAAQEGPVQVAQGGTVVAHVVDLADRDALAAVAARILAEHPHITLLVNNAGIALRGRFEQLTLAEFDTVMAVNFRAPVALTHHLLPALTSSPGSHLVNVSSVFGLIAPAGQSAYSSSKYAVRGFSEVLRAELAPQGIGVTTVHPGGIRTRIAETALSGSGVSAQEAAAGRRAFARMLTYPPERAAEQILDGVERRRARVLIAWSARLPDLLVRLAPTGYSRVLGWVTPRSSGRSGGSGRSGWRGRRRQPGRP